MSSLSKYLSRAWTFSELNEHVSISSRNIASFHFSCPSESLGNANDTFLTKLFWWFLCSRSYSAAHSMFSASFVELPLTICCIKSGNKLTQLCMLVIKHAHQLNTANAPCHRLTGFGERLLSRSNRVAHSLSSALFVKLPLTIHCVRKR